MQIAFVGCGYVADFYMQTLPYHPELKLIGAYDHNPERLANFSKTYGINSYPSLDALLNDENVELVVNLTNPHSHFAISQASLLAGKHVYTEKPLALTFAESQELVQLADQRKLHLASAPCSVLGASAQTLWKALREEKIGKVRLAYAELDDGMTHRLNYKYWKSKSGIHWPYKDEFETGCTIEHAGYYLTWLTTFFGPAKAVTSFSHCIVTDKTAEVPAEKTAPDFSVGCIEFVSGIVARLTCSIVANHNRSLTIFGDDGTLAVQDCWNYQSPIFYEKRRVKQPWLRRNVPILSRLLRDYAKPTYPLVNDPALADSRRKELRIMDYGRGIAEVATALREGRHSRLSADHALHVTEIMLTLQYPEMMGSPRRMQSTFTPSGPMPWADLSVGNVYPQHVTAANPAS